MTKELFLSLSLSALHYVTDRAPGSLWNERRRHQHHLVQELHREAAADLSHGSPDTFVCWSILCELFLFFYFFCGHITALINCLQSSLSPTASCDHPAVYGHPGEPAVHRWARPSHPGCLPAVLCSSALRSHSASLQTVTPACLVTSIGIMWDGLL